MRVQFPGASARRRLPALVAVGALTLGVVVTASAPAQAEPTTSQKITATEATLAALNDKVDRAVEKYNDARLALTDAQHKVEAQNAALAKSAGQVKALQATMGEIAAIAYKSGGSNELSLFFTADTANFLARAGTMDALSRNQQGTVEQLAVAQHGMAVQKQKAQQAADAAQTLSRQLATQKTSIQAQVSQAQTLLTQLQQQKAKEDAAARAARLAAEAAAQAAAQAEAQAVAHAAAPRTAQVAASRAENRSAASQPTSTSRSSGGTTRSAPVDSGSAGVPASGRAGAAVAAALAQLGKPYSWGAAGTDSYDCSGLTSYAWGRAGVGLPHSAEAQYSSGAHVSQSQLQPGDLVFFGSPIHHVGLYVGGGQMIDAPHTGTVVKYQPAVRSDYVGAVRPG